MNDMPKSVTRKKATVIAIISFIAGLLVMLIVLEALIPWIAGPKAPEYGTVPDEIAPNSPEWYTYERNYSDKHALIDIGYSENPVKLIENADFEGGYGWFYSFYLTEMNGIDFRPETYEEIFFDNEFAASTFTYTADDMIMWWGDNLIARNDRVIVRGGLPQQNLTGLGLKISGTDSTGETLEFYGYLEFSQEISE